MVKRYVSTSSGQMEGPLDGRYIRFECYEVLRAKLDRLAKAIEEAPHGKLCASIYAYEYPCDCWKAAALAEEGR